MEKRCVGCGGQLEPGTIRARNVSTATGIQEPLMVVSDFVFIRPGNPTSANPIQAFLHGLRDEPGDQPFPLVALRCTQCARVEFFATQE